MGENTPFTLELVRDHQQAETMTATRPVTANALGTPRYAAIAYTNIVSPPFISPVKQRIISNSPSSPRPIILIRKRVAGEILSSPFSITSTTSTTSTVATSVSTSSSTQLSNCSTTSLTPSSLCTTSITTAISSNPLAAPDSSTPSNTSQAIPTMASLTVVNTSNNFLPESHHLTVNNDKPEHEIFVDNSPNHPSTPNSDASGATPRKKPRKQHLEPFHLATSKNIKLLSSLHDFKDDIDDRDGNILFNSSPPYCTGNYIDSEDASACGAASSPHKKPRPSILTSYNIPWKSLQYHFLRYTDVKQKQEKKLTLSELSNEGLQKKNGWKVQHLVTHIEDTDEREAEAYRKLREVSENFEKCDDILHDNINLVGLTYLSSSHNHFGTQVQLYDKLNDLIRGNLQRSKLFQDQIHEAKQLLIKLTNDHKERVGRLTKKCANKRTFINK